MNYKDLVKQFESLHDIEKKSLILYKSELGELINNLDNNPDFNYYYEKYLDLLAKHVDSIVEPIFKVIDFTSLYTFIDSIHKMSDTIEKALKKMRNKEDITLYRITNENDYNEEKIIKTSQSLAEIIKNNNNNKNVLYEYYVPKNSSLGCIPYEIVYDDNSDRLIINTTDKEEEVLIPSDLYQFYMVNELPGNHRISKVIEFELEKKQVLKK